PKAVQLALQLQTRHTDSYMSGHVMTSSNLRQLLPKAKTSSAEVVPTALYVQIKDRLKEAILDGRLKPHAQLPSESELMRAFDVSRITVRQALNDLQKENLIFKIHGKG